MLINSKIDNNSQQIINSVADEIISTINPHWNTDQKIRYVYLKLGEYLEKNTDFFLNYKLDQFGIAHVDITKIYNDNIIYPSLKAHGINQYKIICKSCALFEKAVFEKLDIDSTLISVESIYEITHWFLVVKSDFDKQYALDLASDLPYIKNCLPTKCFAKYVNHLDENNRLNYIIPQNNGNLKLIPMKYKRVDGSIGQVDVIDLTVMDSKQLQYLDESIGYSKLYQATKMLNSKNFSKRFKETSEIFNIYENSLEFSGAGVKKFKDITIEQINNLKNNWNRYFCREFDKILGIYTDYREDYCFQGHITLILLLENIRITREDLDLPLKALLKKYKKELKNISDCRNKLIIDIIKKLINIEDRFDKYASLRQQYDYVINRIETTVAAYRQLKKPDELMKQSIYELQVSSVELMRQLNVAESSISIKKLNAALYNLSHDLWQLQLVLSNKKYIPLEYIVKKFKIMFPIVFGCNADNHIAEKWSHFSIQGYSEQIVIIKKLLKYIFSELNRSNCCDMENYNDSYGPIYNRIQTYPLKDKETGEYCIGFSFGSKSDENVVQYIYIPSENLLRQRNAIEDMNRFWVVSQRFNKEWDGLEGLNKTYKK